MASSSLLLALLIATLLLLHSSPAATASASPSSSSSSLDVCPRPERNFVHSLMSKCPLRTDIASPLEVTGEMVDRELGPGQDGTYYSILFYASWCPFSRNFQPTFDALSSMFPQIRHLAVEQSSAMPSVLSKYGIHSFPTLLLANRTMRVQYHGGKNIICILNFYREATGLDPVHSDVDLSTNPAHLGSQWPWSGSLQEIIANEPYLALGLLFVSLKVSTQLLVEIIAHLKAVWIYFRRALNFNLFGETRQLLEHVLHAIDVKCLWSKIRRCHKSRNFSKRAKSARVWASSLTSVS